MAVVTLLVNLSEHASYKTQLAATFRCHVTAPANEIELPFVGGNAQ